MSGQRLLLHTSYVLALLNRRDAHHVRAVALRPQVDAAVEIIVTEPVLLEIGNAASRDPVLRRRIPALIDGYYESPACTVVSIDRGLFGDALRLYREHGDKT